jgi:hypothetical protein
VACIAVDAFTKMWPAIEAALALPGLPGAAELRAAAARGCSMAIRAHSVGFQPVAPAFAAAAARAFPELGGHHFGVPMVAALEAYAGDAAGAGAAVTNAMTAVASLPAVAALRKWRAGDDDVDFARVRHINICTGRSAPDHLLVSWQVSPIILDSCAWHGM